MRLLHCYFLYIFIAQPFLRMKLNYKMGLSFLTIILAVVVASLQTECPTKDEDCLKGVIPSPDGNNDLLCTTIMAKTLKAISCFKRCNFPVPQRLTSTWALVNSTCTAKPGCSLISEQFLKYSRCYEGMGEVAGVCAQIVDDFNRGRAQDVSCQFLRSGRRCQTSAIGSCGYLATVMTQQNSETPKYRTAVTICGSENVPKAPFKAFCAKEVFTSIEQKCGVACRVATADSPEALCRALQHQSDCLVAESESCSGSLETYLRPRFDSYAVTNQFLKCNISVDGIVVKPTSTMGRQDCDYRGVLKSCFMIDTLESIHYIFMMRLLNMDFSLEPFCRQDFNFTSQMEKCTAALWACELPVGQVYRQPTRYDNFNPALGTFPLNKWGLQAIADSCPLSPVKSTVLCQGSTPAGGRTTRRHFFNRRTPYAISKRPTPTRNPNIIS